MKAVFECYDALGNLLPRESRDILSSFYCNVRPGDDTEIDYVLGVWIQGKGTKIIPLYLTHEQVDSLVEN